MQWKKLVIIAFIAVAVMVTVVGCGRGTMATVGGEKISKSDFYKRLENMPVQGRPAGLLVLDQMVNEHLVQQLAKKMGISPTEAQIQNKLDMAKKQGQGNLRALLDQRGMTLDDFKAELTAQQAYFNVVTKGIKVSDADTVKYYALAKDKVYTTPERVKVAGIICNSAKRINVANTQIKAGTDFSAVVLNLSEDENSKRQMIPGQLGWVWRGQKGVPPNLIDIAFKLRKDEISQPFPVVINGKVANWVILKCMGHEQKKVRPYNEVKEEIRDAIAFAKGQQDPKVGKMILQARKDAKIKINNEKYKMIATAGTESKKEKK